MHFLGGNLRPFPGKQHLLQASTCSDTAEIPAILLPEFRWLTLPTVIQTSGTQVRMEGGKEVLPLNP